MSTNSCALFRQRHCIQGKEHQKRPHKANRSDEKSAAEGRCGDNVAKIRHGSTESHAGRWFADFAQQIDLAWH